MPIFPTAPAQIHPFFGYRSETRLMLRARALRSRRNEHNTGGRWQAIRTLMSHYASHEVKDLDVRMDLKSPDGEVVSHRAVTDKEGYVVFDIGLPSEWPLPDRPRWEVVELHWENDEGKQCVPAHVLAPGAETHLGVISDVDDTIIETGITGSPRALLRNWRRLLAQHPEERIAVPHADTFYGALGGARFDPEEASHLGESLPATQRPFFFVSSSPWNLFSYLVAFKKAKGLPLGPMVLRDWGLNRETFGSSSHGGHKVDAIKQIVGFYPDMRFALVGDDTQGDVTAFGEVAEAMRGRIAAIFIRKAAADPLSPEEVAAKASIEALGIPMWLGPSYDAGKQFLRATGLVGDKDAKDIVDTVEEAQ